MIRFTSRLTKRWMRAAAFAFSGIRIPTLETRVDSTLNSESFHNHTKLFRFEDDPILRERLEIQLSNKPTLEKQTRPFDSSDFIWFLKQIFLKKPSSYGGLFRTSISACRWIRDLGCIEPPFEIAPDVEIRNARQVSLSPRAIIRSRTIINGRSRCNRFGVECGPDFYVKERCYIDAYNGFIHIGRGAAIAQGSRIHGNGGVQIGDYFMMGGGAMVLAGNHRHSFNEGSLPFIMQGSEEKGIEIGNNVWLGANAIILDGCKVGDNVVIGAGTIVTKDVPAESLIIGVCDRRIRNLSEPFKPEQSASDIISCGG